MGGNFIQGNCLILLISQVSFHTLVFFFLSAIYSQGLYSYVPWWALQGRKGLLLLSNFCSPPWKVRLPFWFSEIVHFLLCLRNAVTILGLHERGFALFIFRFSSLVMLLHTAFSSLLGPVEVCYCLLPGRQFLGVSSPLILSVLPLKELCSLVLFLQLLIFLLREWVLPPLNW